MRITQLQKPLSMFPMRFHGSQKTTAAPFSPEMAAPLVQMTTSNRKRAVAGMLAKPQKLERPSSMLSCLVYVVLNSYPKKASQLVNVCSRWLLIPRNISRASKEHILQPPAMNCVTRAFRSCIWQQTPGIPGQTAQCQAVMEQQR